MLLPSGVVGWVVLFGLIVADCVRCDVFVDLVVVVCCCLLFVVGVLVGVVDGWFGCFVLLLMAGLVAACSVCMVVFRFGYLVAAVRVWFGGAGGGFLGVI